MLEPTENRPPYDEEILAFFDAAINGNETVLLNHLQRFGTASIDRRDSADWTALMYAVRNNNLSAIDILLQHGASVHTESSYGRGALTLAWQYSSAKTLSYLLHWSAIQKSSSQIKHPPLSAAQISEKNILRLKQIRATRPFTPK